MHYAVTKKMKMDKNCSFSLQFGLIPSDCVRWDKSSHVKGTQVCCLLVFFQYSNIKQDLYSRVNPFHPTKPTKKTEFFRGIPWTFFLQTKIGILAKPSRIQFRSTKQPWITTSSWRHFKAWGTLKLRSKSKGFQFDKCVVAHCNSHPEIVAADFCACFPRHLLPPKKESNAKTLPRSLSLFVSNLPPREERGENVASTNFSTKGLTHWISHVFFKKKLV